MSSKIALMIDADNVSYRYVVDVFQLISRHGQIVLKAVYGNWQNNTLQSWQEVAQTHQFEIRRSGSKSSNSTDMQLIIDSMDILHYRPEIDTFCIVSNDADYVPLCRKLRKSNKLIIGMGYHLASEAFIRACDQFIFIGSKPGTRPLSIISGNKLSARMPNIGKPLALRKLITKAFAQIPKNAEDWVTLAELGTALRQVQTGFENKHYGHATLTKLLQSMTDFVEIKTQDSVKVVRLKATATGKKQKRKELYQLVEEAFKQATSSPNEWVTLSALGSALRQVQTGFKTKSYGYANLTKLLQSMSHLVELRQDGSTKFARLKK